MRQNEAILQIDQISKKIQNQDVLYAVSLEVKKGEVFGLLGPNGSGKTTLIRILTGLIKKDSGSISIAGYEVEKQFLQAIAKVGAIVETPAFYGYLSGRKNLELLARMHKGVDQSRINEVIQIVHLAAKIDEPVNHYSLGMKQRLGIAQAILHRPDILILDEPTNGLDPGGMKELRDHLHALSKTGITILISTHLLNEAEELCDRVAIIKHGRILAVKNVKENQRSNQLFHVEVLTPMIDRAKELLASYGEIVSIDHERFVVRTDWDKIPVMNQRLVENNIAVYRLNAYTDSLEDMFLNLTNDQEVEV